VKETLQTNVAVARDASDKVVASVVLENIVVSLETTGGHRI
jgi:hypothetical protein